MLGFEILEDETLFVKVLIPDPNGQLINGIWYAGDPIVSYDPLEGIWEPYQKGADNTILPEGVSSRDAKVLFTEVDLKTHNDLEGSSSKADIVYLEDPALIPETPAYVVFYKAPWNKNGGFQILGGHKEYILVRQEKL